MANLPAFNPASLISNGEPVNATVANRPIIPVYNTLPLITNFQEKVVTSNYTIPSNSEVMIYVNNTSNITLTLPPAQDQYVHKKIRIRKISVNRSTVTLSCISGNTIEDRFTPTPSPTNTTLVLNIPGDEVELEPHNTVWRVNNINLPRPYLSIRLKASTTQTVGTTSTVIPFQNDLGQDVNPLGLWNYSTNEYTCLYTGIYLVSYNISVLSGSVDLITSTRYGNPGDFTGYNFIMPPNNTSSGTHIVYATTGRTFFLVCRTNSGTQSYSNRNLTITFLG